MKMRFMRSRTIAAALLLLVASAGAHADKSADMRAGVESSMSIAGTIAIDAEGRVTHYTIDDADRYPPGVVALLASRVPGWRFEPATADGRAVPVDAAMRLLLVARKTGEDSYDIGIRSASVRHEEPGTSVTRKDLSPPIYPASMNHVRVGGTVFLLLRVDRAGKVAEAFVEQTNLGVLGRPREMDAMRASFERSAVEAARHWTFVPPSRGPSAGQSEWSVRVPVAYIPVGAPSPAPGRWRTYVPGPRHVAPWLQRDELAGAGIDALAPGGVYQVGQGGLRLLTAPGAG
jgi:TonB family protein